MEKLDINCDLGEGEPLERTRELMRLITSANVACGGHAGDETSMTACVALAREFGVRLGAHPGAPSRDDFGRGAVQPSIAGFTQWVVSQTTALEKIARGQGVQLHHIKLHGALYHATDTDPALARVFIECVKTHFPGTKIYCRSGGLTAHVAHEQGVELWEELFADRAYLNDGRLQPRDHAGAVLTSPDAVVARLRQWRQTGQMVTSDGGAIRLIAQTLCVHGDTEGSVEMLQAIRLWDGHCQ